MNLYRIVYFVGSMLSERYYRADNEAEARETFEILCGKFDIVRIELVRVF